MQVTHHYQPLPSLSATLHVVPSSVPLSGKKARRALGLVPSRIVDASLARASSSTKTTTTTTGSFPSSLQLPFTPLPHPPFLLSLSLAPAAESCSSGYAARFISYPTNWEARTAARIPERRFPPLRGMRYREGRREPDGISDERTGIAAAEAPSAFLGVAGVFQLQRDALSPICSGSVN